MENAVIIGILAGILILIILVIVLLFRIGKSKSESSKQLEQLERLSTENNQIRSEMSALKAITDDKMEGLRKDSSDFNQTVNETLREMISSNAKNQSEFKDNLNENMRTSFKEIREENTRSMGEMRTSNERKLEQMRLTVEEKLDKTLTSRLDSSFESVSKQLGNVYKSLGEMKELSTGVTDNVRSLNRVLSNVKDRGTWAEVQLENIFDQTIPNMYEKNFKPRKRSPKLVEFAIKIPTDAEGNNFAYLPVDSKFPMEDYRRLCEASDACDKEAMEAARKELSNKLLAQARKIREYINEPVTTSYAIMYLPTEGLYSEIASSHYNMVEKIQNECNVVITGPSTIMAFMNTLILGYRAMAINKKTKEVQKILGAAKQQHDMFKTVLTKASDQLKDAQDTLGKAQDRNKQIRKKLKSVEELELEEADAILELPDSSED